MTVRLLDRHGSFMHFGEVKRPSEGAEAIVCCIRLLSASSSVMQCRRCYSLDSRHRVYIYVLR